MAVLTGYISQIIGPVVDVSYGHAGPDTPLPSINEALDVTRPDGRKLVIEVQQHIGEDTVRCVAMDSTDGLRRGMEAVATGAAISMPTGESIRGRVLNVTAMGDTFHAARELAYKACGLIQFDGKQNRTDIGLRAINGRSSWD